MVHCMCKGGPGLTLFISYFLSYSTHASGQSSKKAKWGFPFLTILNVNQGPTFASRPRAEYQASELLRTGPSFFLQVGSCMINSCGSDYNFYFWAGAGPGTKL